MASAGRILIIPKGDYNETSTYDMLDLVNHNGTSWLAKKTVKGIEPSTENAEYWQMVIELPNYLPNISGTYGGTGSTEARTIDTGATSRGACLICDYTGGNRFAFVTLGGAICKTAEGIVKIDRGEVSFRDGIIYINSDNPAINYSGYNYKYYVL